jgi:hypothetical protein
VVVIDHSVGGALPTEGNVGFKVRINLVLLDVPGGTLDKEYALGEVSENAVLEDGDGGTLEDFDACKPIRRD